MNEVSNGPGGNQEYVEFVVADTIVSYDCTNSTPPCIDIRGWIYDDNSGYHGTGGIAAGAVRFSQDPLWSCVPLGTIIVIYNDADPNASMPADDISLTDGNCRIIAPISSTTLFESNSTTPGAVACSYPSTGWTPGGNWSNTLLANSGDCARIVDLNGCEVFSVCWATQNQNNLIYFVSGGSGTDNVWYFSDGDPNDQSNWSEGCADPSSCGLNEQTPGLPNNAANQNYISQFNNNCSAITPVSVTASGADATCTCNGTATATVSGSIPGYTYEWYDNSFISTGQSTVTASGLCAGTYYVIVTSSIGCSDTASVVINITGSAPVVTAAANTPVCEGSILQLDASTISGATYSWTGPNGFTSALEDPFVNPVTLADAGSYTVVVTQNGCSSSPETIVVTVNETPDGNAGSNSPVCEGDDILLTSNTIAGATYNWNGPNAFTSSAEDPVVLSSVSSDAGTYTLIVTENGCTDTSAVNIVVNPSVIATIIDPGIFCTNDGAENLLSVTNGGTWSGTGISDPVMGTFDPSIAGVGTHLITYTVSSGCNLPDTILITVNANPAVNAGTDQVIGCSASSVLLDGSSSGTGVYQWTTSNGSITGSSTLNTAIAGSAGVYILTVTSGGCSASDTVAVTNSVLPVALFTATPETGFLPFSSSMINSSGGTSLSYFWLSGDGDTSYASDPVFEYDSAGVYTIMLVVTDQSGCIDTATALIEVFDEFVFIIPNVFTPNGDGWNDYFRIRSEGIETLEVNIYNRWGQFLYSYNDPDGYWDGTREGADVPEGVYFYILNFKKITGETEVHNGTVTLIR